MRVKPPGMGMDLRFNAPTEPLSINAAKSWQKRHRLLMPWKDVTAWATIQALRELRSRDGWTPAVPINVQVELPFRDQRRRDPHNYVGTNVKAIVDGLVVGKLVPDDTPNWVTVIEPSFQIHPTGPLRVVVHVRERTLR